VTRLAPQDRTLAAAAALALAVHFALGGQDAFLPVILALIALLGMPHGALDIALARHLWPIRSARRLAAFLALYLALAAVVVALWLVFPTIALAVFLAYSAWHFSEDWPAAPGRAGRLAGGVLVLALPALAEPARTADLFAALGAEGAPVRQGLAVAGLAAVPVFAITAFGHTASLLRMGFLAGCALVLPPLAYFFVFFCGLHSVRHMLKVSGVLDLDLRGSLRGMVGPTLVTFAVLAAAGLLLVRRGGALDATLMQVVFIGFAALTVPHILLVDRFEARRGDATGANG
jgi:Brp/Blh family beta-carotene 15,15'-monooxygenase